MISEKSKQEMDDQIRQLRAELHPDIVGAGQAGKLRQALAHHLLPSDVEARRSLPVPALSYGLPMDALVGNPDIQPRSAWAVAAAGRTHVDALEFLCRTLAPVTGKGTVAAILGIAGCGKSAAAAAALFRVRLHEPAAPLVWLDASCPAALCRGFVALARRLVADGLVEPRRGGEPRVGAVDVVKAWLRRRDDWLLVLDDVQPAAGLRPLHLPFRNGRVLLTSRLGREELAREAGACEALEMGPFEPAEARGYLTRATGCSEADARDLSIKLRHVPLSLALAAAHLRQHKAGAARLAAALDAWRAWREEGHVTEAGEFLVEPPEMLYELVSLQLAEVLCVPFASIARIPIGSAPDLHDGRVRGGQRRPCALTRA